MAWNYDRPPLEYLQRRVKYYKKTAGTVKNIINEKSLIEKYGKVQLKKLIKERLLLIEQRINEFEDAIKKLQS